MRPSSSTNPPPPRCWPCCGPTCGSRATTIADAVCRRRRWSRASAAGSPWYRCSTAIPPAASSRRCGRGRDRCPDVRPPTGDVHDAEGRTRMTTLGNVLITGGASGLGAATARAVAVAGGRPLIIDRDVPHLDCPHVQADVADADQVERAVAELAAQADDRIDAVFTAAGTDACGPLATVPRADWERVLAVNLSGTVSTVRAAL